ncbi:MAG TPA: TIGR03032 family protein, partial [Cyclobacteriaceae bacterium]|nr:TIGR03032 family protein [Cyclobacteriaceae bacterium]
HELWAVNTRFSCLCTIDEHFSFRPRWKPAFISDLVPEDRCHLNGVAMQDDKPKYVTALGKTDIAKGWRTDKINGGIIIDIESNQIIADGLAMPHSPRLYNNELYVLLSATGELARVNMLNGKTEIIKEMNGFVRGMDRFGDFLFIGLSKLRESSNTFADLPISKKSVFAGIVVFHLPTKSIVGYIKYENSVEEIYDVKVLQGTRRPGLLNHMKEDHRIALTSPEAEYWAVKKEDETS